MLNEARKNQVIKLCQDLVRIKSYSGEETEMVKRLEKAFKDFRFDNYYVDQYGSIIGHIKGNKPGKAILLDGHMDTVEVDDESKWTQNPFGGEIIDGKIYGRGTSDMKGALGAMVCAAAFYAEDTSRNFSGDIYVAGVVHEECFEGVAAREISSRVNPDYVVIGEASQLNLKIGQRGRAEIVIETFGEPAHSANPEKGINAVYKMNKIIQKLHEIKLNQHDVLGEGILELTDIKSSPYPGASVVPEYCKVTYDRRLLIGETKDSTLKPIQQIIKTLQKDDPQLNAKVSYAIGKEKCHTGAVIEEERFFPAWLYDQEEKFIQDVYQNLIKMDLNPEISHYAFCTNGSHYAGERGIMTIGFGPSRENLAHTIDEHIEIEQLVKGMEGYYHIVESACK